MAQPRPSREPRKPSRGREARSASRKTSRAADAGTKKGGDRRDARAKSTRRDQARARTESKRRRYEPVHLSDDVVAELKATARPGKGDILVEVFSRAAAAFAAEDFDEAILLGEQSKHIALRSPAVREFLGLALYRRARWKEAASELSAFRRLTESQDQNPVIADCYRALGRPQRALELCGEIDPKRVSPAIYYEGVIVASGALRDLGRTDEAMSLLESLELDPERVEEHHLRARYALADLLEHRGRFTQARKLFAAIATQAPEVTDAPQRAARLERRS